MSQVVTECLFGAICMLCHHQLIPRLLSENMLAATLGTHPMRDQLLTLTWQRYALFIIHLRPDVSHFSSVDLATSQPEPWYTTSEGLYTPGFRGSNTSFAAAVAAISCIITSIMDHTASVSLRSCCRLLRSTVWRPCCWVCVPCHGCRGIRCCRCCG